MNKKVLYLGLLAPIAVAPLAVVASCADTSNIGNKAFDNIQRSLDYWSRSQTLTLPTDIKNPFLIPTLKSTENFGFITNIPSVSNPDNAKGTIDVKVNIRRGPSENYEKTFTVGGFKTIKQHLSETATNNPVPSSEFFNEAQDQNVPRGILKMDLVSTSANVDDVIKEVEETENDDPKQDKKMDKLISLTGIKKDNGKTTNFNQQNNNKVTEILKKKLNNNQLLRLVDIKPIITFGLKTGIEAGVQVVDRTNPAEENASAIHVLMIEGFNITVDKEFLEDFTNQYVSEKMLSEKKIVPEIGLIPFDLEQNKLSDFLVDESGSNNKLGDGKGVISISGNKRMQYELLDGGHIKGSENKDSKSLRAKFKFWIENDQTNTEITKEITLYGFEFKSNN